MRFHALVRDTRFHPDEALFATFARSAAVNGDWLLHGSLDKTPLTIYANALAMTLVGVTTLPNGVLTLDVHAGEFAARLPNTFAGILLIAVVYAVSKKTTSDSRTALLAMFLAAVSPYAIAFSAATFTDGLMLLFVTLSLWMALRGKALKAGVWLALGLWGKQQALFYFPLLIVLLIWGDLTLTPGERWKRCLIFLLPIVLGIGGLGIWDMARGQNTSLWTLAVSNNNPGRLIRADEALPRLLAWVQHGQFLLGLGWLSAVFISVAFLKVIFQPTRHGWFLAGFGVIYFLLHWFVAFPIYDRYLLLLLPPLWILVAQGITWAVHGRWKLKFTAAQKQVTYWAVVFAGCCTFGLLAVFASEGRYPIGGDHGDYAGIDRLGNYLNAKPLATILYDHWLGWELGYYLGTWTDKRRVYYPTPQALVADALLMRDPAARYLPVPRDEDIQPWLKALTYASFKPRLVFSTGNFLVYQLTPPAGAGCASSAGSSWPGRTGQYVDSCG